MTHKFDEKQMKKLDNPERRKKMPPKETLINLGLKQDDVFADIGCGIGYFSLTASEIVGEKGKVYAIDTSEGMLHELKKKIDDHKIENVELVQSTEYGLGIDSEVIDFAFMCNVLHEIEDKEKFIRKIKKILKDNGRLGIIDWQKRETKGGPSLKHRLDKEEVMELLVSNDFKNIEVEDISEEFYSVVGEI